ncbi:porphobilinogen synthase [Marinithermus hydrothermalis]|uniref:Delta-aminolevulinic acid dehydratase n=1 Tax=Marinithermus hydrothermalis (strain DSM 14884 / JCM 11576 / T1) TaxID=869210 RepID=F2NNZ3_MARHT|nr:porphobilinogen synthase [Marinithermus hydrothermalis]AEB11581.1 Porphobilinogen synthase [Marinithermus hydrothermalis DSM 14884]
MERPRRLRTTPQLRRLVRETTLEPRNLILPLFVHPAPAPEPIASMPGQYRHSLESLVEIAGQAREAGLGGVILFGVLPEEAKDDQGSGAYAEDGIVQEATRRLKAAYPDLLVVADTCLCEYTRHGHCGVLQGDTVDNDATLELLAQTAVSQAKAGADIVAPSAMMDGQVAAIRKALDAAGYPHVPILSYAVKYASAFYGPFREAADSAPAFGDRASYQMDPAAGYWDAVREATLDDLEGADLLMVKPALPYLDLVRELKARFAKPIAAYHVSGEYAMIKAAALNGWIDERRVVLEALTGLRRAGAQVILTYYALEAARWVREG